MGVAMSFILGLFLRSFQFFYLLFFPQNRPVFQTIFYFLTKKTSVALASYGFARLYFACPRSITSGLFDHGDSNSIKNYPRFLVFWGNHD